MKVPYTNFIKKNEPIRNKLIEAFEKVLDSGMYIEGSEVKAFEREFSNLCDTLYSTGISNGTCALHLALRAAGIGENDEVITAPNSFIASAASIAVVGAKPVFIDVLNDLNIDPDKIEQSITSKTKAIIPVHLTGRPAQMKPINEIAKKYNLLVIEDAAQAIGAEYFGKKVGSLGDAACFSLHPLKNLHAFGDAGMFTTNNERLINRIKILKNHGLSDRSTCDTFSFNCKLDEVQASLLRIQTPKLKEWNEERRKLAFNYNKLLQKYALVPEEHEGEYNVYQTYIIQVKKRNELKKFLRDNEVEALVHYPQPIHMQPAASDLNYKPEDFPNTLKLSEEILSLPIYPGLTIDQQEYISNLFKKFYNN